ncbi:hypothetical protein B0T25DRAFT_298458 [Lasiosphaeria hispida]|uniref:Uncharacterized protein n=1 Tax=Lasiosphaeria hispida TaxID=260671 RepID=A0AAJ0HDJ7_9PEZI|nr:hypothetical protein B0T25DRAFT_298458 [Lasiosphaeria hispida]
MPTTPIIRDGFESSHGRFYVVDVGSLARRFRRPRVERIETPRLKAMFLPRLTPEANKMFRDHVEFVRCQLKHYGVEFDEGEFTGQGTGLMKKVLLAEKLDKVPHHIEALREEMHQEWLAQMTPKDLSGRPELIMERYFVDGAGKSVKSRTKKPVGFPYDRHSSYGSGQLREAAEKVAGLHHATAHGLATQTIFLGWTKSTVEKAAKSHVASEEKEKKAEADTRMAERDAQYEEYLADNQDDGGDGSPCGEYMVDCEYIEGEWPDSAEDMTISIHRTSKDGVFKATFDFGIVEGIMILGRDEGLVDGLSKRRDGGVDEDDEPPATMGSKRKGKGAQRGRPAKKAKTTKASRSDKSQSLKFFVRLKSKDTSEGEISYIPMNGVIEFGGDSGGNKGKGKGKVKGEGKGKKSGGGGGNPFSSFTGKVSLSSIGSNIAVTARKVSDVGRIGYERWQDYSEQEHERANASRWGSSGWGSGGW